jgi:hypothetical protein
MKGCGGISFLRAAKPCLIQLNGNLTLKFFIPPRRDNPGPDLACQDSVLGSQAIHKLRNQLHILLPSRSPRRRLYEPEARAGRTTNDDISTLMKKNFPADPAEQDYPVQKGLHCYKLLNFFH